MSTIQTFDRAHRESAARLAHIQVTSDAPPIIYASRLLRQWLEDLFDMDATLSGDRLQSAGFCFKLRVDAGLASGCEQHYHIIPQRDDSFTDDDQSELDIVGSSPAAVLWAVAELGEFWGVRYLTTHDYTPADAGQFTLPRQAIQRKPIFTRRAVRLYNDFPNDQCCWSVEQHRPLIDQLAKMRFNEIVMFHRPLDPFSHLEWRGAAKNDAGACCYGLDYPIGRNTIGFELFEASGDAARGRFENHDLHGHADYPLTLKAGRQYLRGIRELTRERGMSLGVMVLISDFPEPIRQKLVEETDVAHRLPIESGHAKRMRYGRWVEGPDPEVLGCMSLRNPAYLDLLRTALQTYVDSYDGCDYLYLWTSEFRGSQADLSFAWDDLNTRYGIDRVCTLEQLIDSAREQAEIDPDRAEHELKADLCTLWYLDYLIRVNPVKQRDSSPVIVPSGLNWNVHCLLPAIFGDQNDYLAALGYMPTTAFEYASTLSPGASVVLTLEDDNIGPVPQVSGSSLYKTVERMRQQRQVGFITRQWNLAKTQPALDYLAHASWEDGLNLEQSYRRLYEPICGRDAFADLYSALTCLDSVTAEMQRHLECVAFLSPRVVLGRWGDGQAAPFGNVLALDRYPVLDTVYAKSIKLLDNASGHASTEGRSLIEALKYQTIFARQWLEAQRSLYLGTEASRRAAKAQRDREAFDYDTSLQEMSGQISAAQHKFHQATNSWAKCVEDRCDLGTLAALNIYVVKVIDAIAMICYVRSKSWNLDL